MIIHTLLLRYFRHGDDEPFYVCQARDSIAWLERSGVALGPKVRALDLGCGHGIFGRELLKKGCQVTFADEINILVDELKGAPFKTINLDREDMASLGRYDLVICSNVYEHLSQPEKFITEMDRVVEPGGRLYLSWTNWFSPFGGHEFSPFHYLGPQIGRKLKMTLSGKPTKHQVGQNLYVTFIGKTLRLIRSRSSLKVTKTTARYYPELSFLVKIPVLREFVAWNCAILLEK
jgi:2-polyprenyl-3-methyl-5-hydroxy-6-metoxy-1,4-benzoquinol methylase